VSYPIYGPHQVDSVVQGHQAALNEQWQRLSAADRRHQADRHQIDAERAQSAEDLARAILPTFDAEAIACAAQTVGLVGLPGEDLPGKREARRAFLLTRLEEIGRDPRYRDRELLRHPNTGTLTLAINESLEHRGPLAEVVNRCEYHARFRRLLELDFGSASQSPPWWRLSYWSDRSAAAEIVEGFPGRSTFLEVREEYRVAKDAVAVYDAELSSLRAKVATGEALDREYATLSDEHHNLDRMAIDYTRARIVTHMLGSDASLMAQRLASHKDISLLFLRVSGLTAKLSYLDAIHKKNADELRAELNAQKAKLDAVYQRTVARGRGMPGDKFQSFAKDRRPQYERRWQRWGKTYQTVYVYDRWDRGRHYEDLLWWDLMTRGRHDGSYIHDVTVFHHAHPDYEFDPTPQRHESPDLSDAREEGDAAAASIRMDAGVDAGGGDVDLISTDAS
jgi:hypothetical protein